jgi:hypothetical protein
MRIPTRSSDRRGLARLTVPALCWLLAACAATTVPSGSTGKTSGATAGPPLASVIPTNTGPARTAAETPPSAGSWAAAGSLKIARLHTRIAALGSGALLVVGDDNICTPGFSWPNSVLSDLSLDGGATWSPGGSLPRERDRFLLETLDDGSAMVVGGTTMQGRDGPGSFRSTFKLDPVGSEGWVRSTDLNTARSSPAGTVFPDGRLLVAGGFYIDLPANPPAAMIRSSEIFDPGTGQWAGTGQLRTARYGAGMVTLSDGRALIVGGWPDVDNDAPAPMYGTHTSLRSTEIYDPTTGAWSGAGDLPAGVAEPKVVALAGGGAIVMIGPAASRFDPEARRWVSTAPMVGAWTDRSLVALNDGRVMAAGGAVVDPGTRYGADVEVYDPVADRWTAIEPMPTARAGGAALLLQDASVVIIGGEVGQGPQGDPYCPLAGVETVRFTP